MPYLGNCKIVSYLNLRNSPSNSGLGPTLILQQPSSPVNNSKNRKITNSEHLCFSPLKMGLFLIFGGKISVARWSLGIPSVPVAA